MNEITSAITQVDGGQTSLVPRPCPNEGAGSWLNFIARAMADPTVNVEKLEVLVRMQREIVAEEAMIAFNVAMSAAQAEMLPIVRDAENKQTKSRYALLETIDAGVRPIYTRHGFCLTFNSEPMPAPNLRIVCLVSLGRHTQKYSLDAAWDTVGPNGNVNKTPMHGLGSSVSYLRRYLTCMIFNLVLKNDDEDGNVNRATDQRRAPAPFIVQEQAIKIEALITEAHADRAAFMRYFKLDSLLDMRIEQFTPAVSMLNAKKAQAAKAEAEAHA